MWFAIGFSLASAVGMYLLQGYWYLAASGVAALVLAVCLGLMLRFRKLRIVAVCLLGCVVGFVWLSFFETAYLSVPREVDETRMVLTLTATDFSYETDYGCTVEGIGQLNGKPYTIRIYLPKKADISPGDTLTARFLLRCTLPGGSAHSPYHSSDGVFLSAKAFRMPDIVKAEQMPWYGYPAWMRQIIKAKLAEVFPVDTSGFAIALFIGDTDAINYETDISFKISGISHIIAVSGFHVTVLFSLVYFLLGKKRFLAAVIGIPVLFLFAAVAGFSPSIMRACLMHSLMIVGLLFDQDYDPPTALGFAVLVMLFANPWTVTNVGFQLSVGCMAGILLFAERIKAWILERKAFARIKGKRKKIVSGFAVSVGMSVGAAIVVTPLCAYYFGMVSLVSVITNLLTTWIITLVFYGVMLAFVAALIWTPIGSVVGWIVAWPIRYVLLAAKTMAAFPLAAVYMDSIYMVLWLIFTYILLGVFLLSKPKPILLTVCSAVIALCIALTASWVPPRMDECRVTVLDVGQGQCILLQSNGKTFMVDCGGDSDTQAANTAAKALLAQGVDHLDGLILTHYDSDHAAGAQYLLGRVPADILYLPTCADADGTVSAIQETHEGERLMVSQDICITFDSAKITLIPSRSNLSDNESGLCVLFQTQNCDILITGDRSMAGEQELMRYLDLPELEVLIVGHHGSKYSTSVELLEKTSPEIAIISVGADNLYGHPTQETIQRLLEAGCEIYRTDLHGTIVYRR